MGAELVIDRNAEGFRFWKDEHTQDPKEWKRFGERIRELTGGDDPDIVFEHPGRETFGASVYVARKGGTIVTCASTSRLPARVRQPLPVDEPQADRRLATSPTTARPGRPTGWSPRGKVHPTLSKTYPLARDRPGRVDVHRNAHQGKVGVLALAPREGLGVTDPELRAKHLEAINRFRGI